ncbi:MAG: hypothetical protein FJZ97_11715 [Chloroflexi bacterium]|nr:hypothetical protein [Chloroflexota bacterium]
MPDDTQQQDAQQQTTQGGADGGTPPTFETWLEGQSDEVKGLLDSHTQGLRSALESERGSRKDLEKQVRDLAGKADAGSEAQAQLTKLADGMAEADRRADFYEAAHGAGITNLKLAYTVAVQDEMFNRRGGLDFEAMKAAYPELFAGARLARPPGNAGAGTGGDQPRTVGMNDFIRRAAGR